jgi:hypothetical protein
MNLKKLLSGLFFFSSSSLCSPCGFYTKAGMALLSCGYSSESAILCQLNLIHLHKIISFTKNRKKEKEKERTPWL